MPPVGACIFHILIQFHQIVIVGNSGVAEQLTIEYIIPAAIGYRVSPVQVAVIFIIDFSVVVVLIVVVAVGGVKVVVVLSFIETDEEAAAVIEFMVHLGIDVVKVVVVFIGVIIIFIHYEVFEEGGVRGTCTKTERSVSFPDRSFKMQFVGKCTYTECTVVMVHISVVGAYIDNRGKPTAVTGGKGTLVECSVFYSFGSKYGEHPQKMICIIYRNTV